MNTSDEPSDATDRNSLQGPDVFLSYSRDDQPIARKVLERLEKADISVWWDAMLEGGARFHQVTEQNLEQARAVVVLWSKKSTASHWVHDEATRGRERGCLIPVSIDGSVPPLGFRQFQWIDLSNSKWETEDPEIAKLIAAVKHRTDPEFAGSPDWQPAYSAGAAAGRGDIAEGFQVSRRMVVIGGGLTAVAAGGVIAWNTGILGGNDLEAKIAVLPFNILQAEGSESYFVEGFAASIRGQLSRNPLLHVAAKASSSAVDSTTETVGEICKALGVNFLLTGSVRRSNDRVQVTGELSEGASDRLVLPIEFEGPVDRIFEIQSQIASDVVAQITDQASGANDTEVGGTQNIAAYDAFLRGQQLYDAGIDEASDRAALARFDEAIALDPNYAAAHSRRGRALALIGNLYGDLAARERDYGAAQVSAEKAVELAPEFADGHSVLGYVRSVSLLDMKAAKAPYDRANELGQGDADILSRYAIFRARNGDYQTAREAIARASTLDPLNARVFRFAGNIAYYSRQFGAAVEQYERADDLQPGLSSHHYYVGLSQMARGDNNAAKSSFERERRFVFQQTGLAVATYRLGDRSAAQRHFDDLKERQGDKSNYQYMQILAQWGETEAALNALDDAWTAKDPGLVQMFNDPLLDPLREEAVFQAAIDRIGFG